MKFRKFINKENKKILVGAVIFLILLAVAIHFSPQPPTKSGTLYYTRPTGCYQGQTVEQIPLIAHSTYFKSPEDCLNYNNPIGYLSIVGN